MTSEIGDGAARSFLFGSFVLIPERQLLLDGEVPVRIGGRALDILTVLVERPGELVSKAELLARVWPDTIVEEGNPLETFLCKNMECDKKFKLKQHLKNHMKKH